MRARWKLGQLLKLMEKGGVGGRPSTKKPTKPVSGFWKWCKDKGLDPPTTVAAKRISALPEDELVETVLKYSERPLNSSMKTATCESLR